MYLCGYVEVRVHSESNLIRVKIRRIKEKPKFRTEEVVAFGKQRGYNKNINSGVIYRWHSYKRAVLESGKVQISDSSD